MGVLSTRRGRPIEILPKIDLAEDHKETRGIFLEMLRTWRGLRHAELPQSAIRSLRRYPMMEVFARLFLQNLSHLARHGLARRYVRIEDNLPYLRGRLLFQQHVRENLNQQGAVLRCARRVQSEPAGESADPQRLWTAFEPIVRNEENRRLLRELTDAFADVPPVKGPGKATGGGTPSTEPCSTTVRRDGLGAAVPVRPTASPHFTENTKTSPSCFPMEEIYEDFVTQCFRHVTRTTTA